MRGAFLEVLAVVIFCCVVGTVLVAVVARGVSDARATEEEKVLEAAQTERTGFTEWTYKACYTNECIAATLGSLSHERAAEAKLTTWRDTDTTYVWYRK